MVVFPNCKINLGLHVRRKREDGYHDLETIFYPVPKKDILELIPSPDNQVTLHQEGLTINGSSNDNLIIKAYELIKKDFPQLPAVHFFLYKAVPMGAGLGGGSADGSFALTLLNDRFKLQIPAGKLCEYALQMGSDCPFFILNSPAYATSRGEKMEKTELDLSGYWLAVVNPGIHINTGWAFGQLALQDKDSDFRKIAEAPLEQWKEILYNDFETPIFNAHPEVQKLKQGLYDKGAVYASMSGSGSSCFGIFSSKPDLSNYPAEYFKENYLL